MLLARGDRRDAQACPLGRVSSIARNRRGHLPLVLFSHERIRSPSTQGRPGTQTREPSFRAFPAPNPTRMDARLVSTTDPHGGCIVPEFEIHDCPFLCWPCPNGGVGYRSVFVGVLAAPGRARGGKAGVRVGAPGFWSAYAAACRLARLRGLPAEQRWSERSVASGGAASPGIPGGIHSAVIRGQPVPAGQRGRTGRNAEFHW